MIKNIYKYIYTPIIMSTSINTMFYPKLKKNQINLAELLLVSCYVSEKQIQNVKVHFVYEMQYGESFYFF